MRSSLVRFWLAVKVGSDPRLQWSINMRAAMKKNNNNKKTKKTKKITPSQRYVNIDEEKVVHDGRARFRVSGHSQRG